MDARTVSLHHSNEIRRTEKQLYFKRKRMELVMKNNNDDDECSQEVAISLLRNNFQINFKNINQFVIRHQAPFSQQFQSILLTIFNENDVYLRNEIALSTLANALNSTDFNIDISLFLNVKFFVERLINSNMSMRTKRINNIEQNYNIILNSRSICYLIACLYRVTDPMHRICFQSLPSLYPVLQQELSLTDHCFLTMLSELSSSKQLLPPLNTIQRLLKTWQEKAFNIIHNFIHRTAIPPSLTLQYFQWVDSALKSRNCQKETKVRSIKLLNGMIGSMGEALVGQLVTHGLMLELVARGRFGSESMKTEAIKALAMVVMHCDSSALATLTAETEVVELLASSLMLRDCELLAQVINALIIVINHNEQQAKTLGKWQKYLQGLLLHRSDKIGRMANLLLSQYAQYV